jgi:hypothetical protein
MVKIIIWNAQFLTREAYTIIYTNELSILETYCKKKDF